MDWASNFIRWKNKNIQYSYHQHKLLIFYFTVETCPQNQLKGNKNKWKAIFQKRKQKVKKIKRHIFCPITYTPPTLHIHASNFAFEFKHCNAVSVYWFYFYISFTFEFRHCKTVSISWFCFFHHSHTSYASYLTRLLLDLESNTATLCLFLDYELWTI